MDKPERVEQIIDGIVEGLPVEDAISVLLDGDDLVESVEFDEDEQVFCPVCENPDLEECVMEDEDQEVPLLYCSNCDTALIPDLEEGEEELEEAELDDENPVCVECGGKLEGEVVEDEGVETPVFYCDKCDIGYVADLS